MAQVAPVPPLALHISTAVDRPRHSVVVRITHWLTVVNLVVLLISGIAILLAHPRHLPFLFAWTSLFTALVYISVGLARQVEDNLLPARRDVTIRRIWGVIEKHLRFKRPSEKDLAPDNVLQRLSYTTVVFVLAPLTMWTGLAMSPAVTSVFPIMVTVFGDSRPHERFISSPPVHSSSFSWCTSRWFVSRVSAHA